MTVKPSDFSFSNRPEFEMGTTRAGNRGELLASAQILLDFANLGDFEGEISAKHTADLFAAFLQLRFAQPPDGSPGGEEPLQFLVSRMSVDHVIDSLMALISAKPPKWMASACGRYLSTAVLRPGGVFVVMDRMLRSSAARDRGDVAVAGVTKHIASVPACIPKGEYFAAICPQLASILQQSSKLGDSVIHAATLCVKNLAEADSRLVLRHFVEPVAKPFSDFLAPDPAAPPGTVIADERCIEITISVIARLLSSELMTAEVMAPLFSPSEPRFIPFAASLTVGSFACASFSRSVSALCVRVIGSLVDQIGFARCGKFLPAKSTKTAGNHPESPFAPTVETLLLHAWTISGSSCRRPGSAG